MKVRIKHFNGELPSYLTLGKVYDVSFNRIGESKSFNIACDKGGFINCHINDCFHLNGGSWEIVEE